jgi:hypothetical protein
LRERDLKVVAAAEVAREDVRAVAAADQDHHLPRVPHLLSPRHTHTDRQTDRHRERDG